MGLITPAYEEQILAAQKAAQAAAQNKIASMQPQITTQQKDVVANPAQKGFYTYENHTLNDGSGLVDVYTPVWKRANNYRDEQGVVDYLKSQPAGTKLRQLSRWEHAPETQHQRQTYVNYFLDNDGNLMYQPEKPNYILKPDEENWWRRPLDTFIAFVDPIGTTIRGTYDAIQDGDWASALHQISTFAPAIDYGLSNVGTWANDISGGQSGQFMDIAAPIVAGIIGTVYGGPFGGAAGATIGKSIAGRWSKDYRGQSEEDILKGTAITGALSAASAGLGSYLSGAGTAAATGLADATMPALNGLETYTMGGATAAYPTTQPIFNIATGEFLSIPSSSDAFTNYVVNNGYLGLDSSGMWNGTPTSPDNYVGNFYNTAEYPKFTATEPSSSINYEKLLKDTVKKALSGGGKTKQPPTGISNAGFGNVADTSSLLSNQITNATYPQAQATPSQVPLEGYSKFNRALTPYNLRKKKKLIEDELYPYIA